MSDVHRQTGQPPHRRKIVFPDDDTIRFESERLCAEPDGLLCRRFVGRAFLAPEIDRAVIDPATAEGVTPAIELRFDSTQYGRRDVLERVAEFLECNRLKGGQRACRRY